jgi:FAD:protein FMN transferase
MRKTALIMGMPITVDIVSCTDHEVFTEVFSRFQEIDKKFSKYKKDSELCKYQRCEISEEDLSTEFKEIIAACKEAEKYTFGYFSVYYKGRFDPTGYIKGWALTEAGKYIEKNGYKTYCIGAGGDNLAKSSGKKDWKIGIQDPLDSENILNTLSIYNGGIATSGNYERGNHIFNPFTGEAADELISITVIGPDIIKADVLATASYAAGVGGLVLIEDAADYEALAVAPNGDWYITTGMEKLMRI